MHRFSRRATSAAVIASLSMLSVVCLAGPAAAKGGGPTPPAPAPAQCARFTVTNNPQTVKNAVMPAIKYNLESCGSESMSLTVAVTETPGFLSDICPSPVAAPVQLTLAPKQKISATAPAYRGPCGEVGPSNQTVVDSARAWQGHNLLLTATNNVTGEVVSSSAFIWQDQTPRV